MISLLRHACNVCCIPIFTAETPVKRHATVPRQHQIHIPEIKCAWRGAALRMRQSLFHYLFISTKQWRRSRNCWASNFVSNADQNICGGKNWSHKYYRMTYQQQQPVQWWRTRLYPAHGEDRGKNCRHLQHRPVRPPQPTHGLGSGPGQGCGLFFARHHGEPVYWEMVLILIHIVGSYYTGIHRPPLSADWYQQWPKINYLHCVLHKIRTREMGERVIIIR